MNVLFTRPLTAPRNVPLPGCFDVLADEAELSTEFQRNYPLGGKTEHLARLWLAYTLFRRRGRYAAVVTGRYGELLMLLQGMVPFLRRPSLLLDIEWYETYKTGWRIHLNRWLHRRIVAGASRIQVFCHAEATNYARYFGVDQKKFVWIPYCTDAGSELEPVTGDYILTSGVHQRDYPTLLAAVKDLPVEIRVVAPQEHFRSLAVPGNVKILGRIPEAEYWRQLCAARLLVLALEKDVIRRPGVITYVGAMRLGKCVVVNDNTGAASYIEHGKTGFLVPPADPSALREQIRTLLASPELVEQTAAQARKAAAERFSAAAYYAAIQQALHGIGNALL